MSSVRRRASDHKARIASMRCALCERLGQTQARRTEVHHVREGQGVAQRASDYLAIPLCSDCHRGPQGLHGDRSLWKVAKVGELDLLADTIEKIAEG